MPTPLLTEKDFWSRVEKTDNCWLWKGTQYLNGYGLFRWKAKRSNSHRVSWIIKHGPIPQGLLVCHHCDVRLCVRPDHLFLGTQKDNLADAKRKGRTTAGRSWPHPQTSETRIKIRDALKGGPHSPEWVAKVVKAKTGVPLSMEHRAKLSAMQKGKRKTPEHAANISRGMKGVRKSPEHIEKMKIAGKLNSMKRKRNENGKFASA